MIAVKKIKADVEALKMSQKRAKGGSTEEILLTGFKLSKTGGTVTLTSFDGTSETVLCDRDWGESLPDGVMVISPQFLQIVERLDKESEIDLVSPNKGQLLIKQGRSKWKSPCAEDARGFYPLTEDILSGAQTSTCIELEGEVLREGLLNVYPSLSAENQSYCSAKINFNVEERTLTTMGTDTRRSSRWQAVNVVYPILPEKNYSVLIPGQKVLSLCKLLKVSGKIAIYFTDSIAVFHCAHEDTSFAVRLNDGSNYPPIERLLTLPFSNPYTVEPKALMLALKRAKVLLPSNKLVVSNTIKFTFEKDTEKILIEHESDLFTEEVGFKKDALTDGYTVRLNLDYTLVAVSILTAETCDFLFNPAMVKIVSQTLHGELINIIAVVSIQE
jgi:DNA polymerase III sliding clamp (beta) subunit (PCNA family)